MEINYGVTPFILLIFVVILKPGIGQVAESDLFPYDTGNDDEFIFGDDAFLPIDLQIPFHFFNNTYNTTFLSGNGQISFQQGISSFTPSCSSSQTPMIMAFWADSVSDDTSRLFHYQTTNRTLLRKATTVVFTAFPEMRGIALSWMLVVTWKNMRFFGSESNCDGISKRNTYQLALASDGYNSFALMYYNKIDWTTGTASSGNCSGLGGYPAKAGFDYGDGQTLRTIPGSCTNSIINITQTSNIHQPGKWIFRINDNLETSTCDTFNSEKQKLKLYPNIVSFVGLVPIKLEGPCLEPGAIVSCIFHDFNLTTPLDIEVVGIIDSDNDRTVICSAPFFHQIGRKKVDLKVLYPNTNYYSLSEEFNEKDGAHIQDVKIYSGFLYVLDEHDVGENLDFTLEKQYSGIEIKYIFTAQWDPTYFQSDSKPHPIKKRSVDSDSEVDIFLQAHDGRTWRHLGHLKRSIENIGSYQGPIATSPLENFSATKDFTMPVVTMVSNNVLPENWHKAKKLTGKLFIGALKITKHFPPGFGVSCQHWYTTTSPPPTDTRPCPRNLEQADVDDNFENDGAMGDYLKDLHPGGRRSKRQAVPSESGAGSQCVYDKDGNLMVGPRSGGTLDRYSPKYSVPGHYYFDVMPYSYCCNSSRESEQQLINDLSCKAYYVQRPSDNGANYRPRRVVRAMGDPHITTFDGFEYTFNGVGEFWMVKFNGRENNLEFKMQARMEQYVNPHGIKMNASVFTAACMEEVRNGESVKVQVSYADDKIFVTLDNETVDIDQVKNIRELTLQHKSSSVKIRSSENVVVTFSSGFSFQFSILGPNEVALNIFGSGDQNLMNFTEGLMGNFDGDLENDMRIPEGTTLPMNSSSEKIHFDFGMKWIVQEIDSIFTYPPGKSYKDYYQPDFTPTFLTDIDIELLDQSVVETCGGSKDCIFDYVTTGSPVFANATKSSNIVYEEIVEVVKREVKMCQQLGNPENGYQKITNLIAGAGKVEFYCDEGYYLKYGPVECSCNDEGIWNCNGNIPTECITEDEEDIEPFFCDEPPKLSFGHVIGSNYSMGSTIQLECISKKYDIFWKNCHFNGPGGICKEFCNVTYTCVKEKLKVYTGATVVKGAVWKGVGGDINEVRCLGRFAATIAKYVRTTALSIHVATLGKLVSHMNDGERNASLIGC